MKKLLTALAILCIVSCANNKATLTNNRSDMTNNQLREKIVKALEDMESKAIEMGIQGVATATVLRPGETDDWLGEMKVVGPACNRKEGWNLVAIAWSKCGEVIATGADSGAPDHQKMLGELGFVGGAYDEFEGYKLAFAFSGALSEEDLEVAKYGIEKDERLSGRTAGAAEQGPVHPGDHRGGRHPAGRQGLGHPAERP